MIVVFPDHTHLLFLRKSEHALSLCRGTGEQVNLFEGGGHRTGTTLEVSHISDCLSAVTCTVNFVLSGYSK